MADRDSTEVQPSPPPEKYFYSLYYGTVLRYCLRTGRETRYKSKLLNFLTGASWHEVGKRLYIVGGFEEENYLYVNCCVSLDLPNDFATTQRAFMLYERGFHGGTFHRGYIYAIGGDFNYLYSQLCERLNLSGDEWEQLPEVPYGCKCMSVDALEATNCLYAIGGIGYNIKGSDKIQRLNLKTLIWDLLPFRSIQVNWFSSCFKLDETSVYTVYDQTLHVFNSESGEDKALKSLDIENDVYFSRCCYYNESLFLAIEGKVLKLHLGPLS